LLALDGDGDGDGEAMAGESPEVDDGRGSMGGFLGFWVWCAREGIGASEAGGNLGIVGFRLRAHLAAELWVWRKLIFCHLQMAVWLEYHQKHVSLK
jgi:hypothetical protein